MPEAAPLLTAVHVTRASIDDLVLRAWVQDADPDTLAVAVPLAPGHRGTAAQLIKAAEAVDATRTIA